MAVAAETITPAPAPAPAAPLQPPRDQANFASSSSKTNDGGAASSSSSSSTAAAIKAPVAAIANKLGLGGLSVPSSAAFARDHHGHDGKGGRGDELMDAPARAAMSESSRAEDFLVSRRCESEGSGRARWQA